VFQSVSNPREVTVLTQWDTLDHAKDYFGSEELPARMQRFGVVGSPEVHFLEDARLVRRTAAD
jgi:heme-degrading monooxygenase HmoA